jgi:4-oxalomesaconate hydratase
LGCIFLEDYYDHSAQEARVVAQAHGRRGAAVAIGARPVFLFGPHQPEHRNWKPQVILNISEVWQTKRKVFEAMDVDEHLWEYNTWCAGRAQPRKKNDSSRSVSASVPFGNAAPGMKIRIKEVA